MWHCRFPLYDGIFFISFFLYQKRNTHISMIKIMRVFEVDVSLVFVDVSFTLWLCVIDKLIRNSLLRGRGILMIYTLLLHVWSFFKGVLFFYSQLFLDSKHFQRWFIRCFSHIYVYYTMFSLIVLKNATEELYEILIARKKIK